MKRATRAVAANHKADPNKGKPPLRPKRADARRRPTAPVPTLTPKQQRFVLEFLVDLNATQAAIRAGYSRKTANQIAAENLAKPGIADAIANARAAVAEALQCSVDDIAREMHKLAFANMDDYMTRGQDGDPRLDWSKLTRSQAAALSEVTVDDFVDGRGKDAKTVRRVKFKLADKRASLVDLAKLLGVMPERHEHTGKDGGPIENTVTVYEIPGNAR